MNYFDIAVIVIIAFCLIRGLFRGLIREVTGIIGVIAGFYGAYTYYEMAAAFLARWIHTPVYQNLAAFFLLFCIILVAVSLASLLIRALLKVVFLGWVDFLFGMFFGAAKGLLIVVVIFIMITTFWPGNSALLSRSAFAPHVAKVASTLMVVVSKNFKAEYFKELEKVKQLWKP